jgi:hypothetical protein
LPHLPFSGAGSVICQPTLGVMMVHCLFFNFVGLFDFGCCSLAQEMIFVIHYLPCFRQLLITCLLSTFLPFQHLFINGSWRLAPCLSRFLQCTFSDLPLLLCCVLVYNSLFIVQFFWGGGGQSAQGVVLVYSGGAGGISHDTWCSPFWSAKFLTGRFGTGSGGSGSGSSSGSGSPQVFSV